MYLSVVIHHFQLFIYIIYFIQVRIWGRNPAKATQCASDVGGGNVEVFQDIEMACKDADVIVTVTMATEPILKGCWLKDGAIVIGRWVRKIGRL